MKTDEKIGLIASYIFILFLLGFFVYLTITEPLFSTVIAFLNIGAAGFISFLVIKRFITKIHK